MINLSLNELKLVPKSRNIKDYKSKSESDLIKMLSEPKPKVNLSKKKIKEIKKESNALRFGFSKSKVNEFRGSLYNMKNKKNLSAPKMKKTEKNLQELEKSLSSLKKYYDYDETKYREIRDIENLFNRNLLNRVAPNKIDKDYYKLINTKTGFNNNYTEYESKRDKNKNLLLEKYLNIIRTYLGDMINNDKTQNEWKIQLTMQINLICSKDYKETQTMHSKSDNIECIIMMGNETDEIIEKKN